MKILGAPRVAHRVGRFVASADRRRGQLCTFGNPPGVHLKLGGMLFKQPRPLLTCNLKHFEPLGVDCADPLIKLPA